MDGRRSAGPGKTIITEIYYTQNRHSLHAGSASGRWPESVITGREKVSA